MMWFIILLLLNLIIAICYLVWNVINQFENYMLKTIVMILCPVVGPGYFFLSYLWYKLFMSDPVDLEDVIFSKERVATVNPTEEEKERNLVPFEEAIAVTSEEELRKLMMNIVRGDIRQYLGIMAEALNSEDSETAHYAASVLQDALSEFRTRVEKQKTVIREQEEGWQVQFGPLIEYMDLVLSQKVFTELEQKSYVNEMDEICEFCYAKAPELMASKYFEAVSMRLLEAEDYEKCQKWCERAWGVYPNTLSTYTCLLKLYFNSGEKEKFMMVLEELKRSSVVVDRETLELLRVFRQQS